VSEGILGVVGVGRNLGGVGVGRNFGCSRSRKEFWVGSESEGILGVVEVGGNFGWSRKECWV
jgi:hypothetical protein